MIGGGRKMIKKYIQLLLSHQIRGITTIGDTQTVRGKQKRRNRRTTELKE
jgi:hypothetical protein